MLTLESHDYRVMGGGVLGDKNEALLLNKAQEVWYQSFLDHT